MMCPHCEKANPEDAKICVWCGAPLASEEAASPAVKRRRPRWMIVTAAVLAAVVTVVSIGAVMIGKRDREGLLGTWRIDVPVG
ncbi:MAG: zinc ribbon domain-containing protein [Clostridia bacterium]|nr:zinc ribbon domain-containing protein [Clostridia bacterium]